MRLFIFIFILIANIIGGSPANLGIGVPRERLVREHLNIIQNQKAGGDDVDIQIQELFDGDNSVPRVNMKIATGALEQTLRIIFWDIMPIRSRQPQGHKEAEQLWSFLSPLSMMLQMRDSDISITVGLTQSGYMPASNATAAALNCTIGLLYSTTRNHERSLIEGHIKQVQDEILGQALAETFHEKGLSDLTLLKMVNQELLEIRDEVVKPSPLLKRGSERNTTILGWTEKGMETLQRMLHEKNFCLAEQLTAEIYRLYCSLLRTIPGEVSVTPFLTLGDPCLWVKPNYMPAYAITLESNKKKSNKGVSPLIGYPGDRSKSYPLVDRNAVFLTVDSWWREKQAEEVNLLGTKNITSWLDSQLNKTATKEVHGILVGDSISIAEAIRQHTTRK